MGSSCMPLTPEGKASSRGSLGHRGCRSRSTATSEHQEPSRASTGPLPMLWGTPSATQCPRSAVCNPSVRATGPECDAAQAQWTRAEASRAELPARPSRLQVAAKEVRQMQMGWGSPGRPGTPGACRGRGRQLGPALFRGQVAKQHQSSPDVQLHPTRGPLLPGDPVLLGSPKAGWTQGTPKGAAFPGVKRSSLQPWACCPWGRPHLEPPSVPHKGGWQ